MRMRLRQVALVAHDLAAAEAELIEHLGVSMCFRDPGVATFGLANALFPLGDKLLEVVSPTEDGTTAGRFLERRGGDGGYMVILQVDDLDTLRGRFEEAGARVVFEAKAEGVTGLHLHPRDVGGAILSVDQTDAWDEWPWAGPEWRDHRSDESTDIVSVTIAANDPGGMAARWAAVLDRSVTTCDPSCSCIELDEGTIIFEAADGAEEGVVAIGVETSTLRSLAALVGCRFVPTD